MAAPQQCAGPMQCAMRAIPCGPQASPAVIDAAEHLYRMLWFRMRGHGLFIFQYHGMYAEFSPPENVHRFGIWSKYPGAMFKGRYDDDGNHWVKVNNRHTHIFTLVKA